MLLRGSCCMVANSMMRNMVGWAVEVLTPVERWSAARRLGGSDPIRYASENWFYLIAVVLLVILLGLLWWVSHRRRPISRELTQELFSENALRRGLNARERQILLAIVMRSGLGQTYDIFTTVDAFDRGATKLLAECVRTRNPSEIERLKTEVSFLREKLGFEPVRRPAAGGATARRPSSHDIPVGKTVEVTRRQRPEGMSMRGLVVRNDDIELALELDTPVESQAGDFWRARYTFGMSVWEFDTTVVSCENNRLVFNHVDNVRFVNRRRFPRVTTALPALVAAFPFTRRLSARLGHTGNDEARGSLGAPVFVRGVVTELAGPGLRIEAPLQIRTGDRILVVFQSPENSGSGAGKSYAIEDIGQVRHCLEAEGGVSLAVELIGLSEGEIDELVRITNAIVSLANGPDADGSDVTVAAIDGEVAVQRS